MKTSGQAYWKGKKLSKEHRLKMSISRKNSAAVQASFNDEWKRKQRIAQTNPATLLSLNCELCGKQFNRPRWRKQYSRIFCSVQCSGEAMAINMPKPSRTMTKPHRLFIQLFENKFGVILEVEHKLVTDNGQVRFYDCKIPDANILFEVDGKFWHSGADQRKRDADKDSLAERLGYILYRVPEDKIFEFIETFQLAKREVPV